MRKAILCIIGLLMAVIAMAADDVHTFTARVLDESGTPVVGAHVVVKDTKIATVTNEEGLFTLKSENNVLHVSISFLGYKKEEQYLKANHRNQTIELTPDQTLLEQVVITATRTPKALKDVPVVTRLISLDDIRKADATNIQDLLTDQLPGLEFGYAMSQETSLTMNGFGGNAVLFLVDGERLAGETMDNVDYNRLNLDNVGRIEVVKGASSALYGANAVGGVVNIISRESSEPWTANVNSRYKTDTKEWRKGASFSFNRGKWNSQTNVQHTATEPLKLVDDPFDTQSKIQQVYGGNCLNVKERLVYTISDKARLIARGGYFNRMSNRNNYDDKYYDYSGGLKGEFKLGGMKTLEVSYAYDQYDKTRYTNGVRTDNHDYSNRQHVLHALYNMPLASKHTLTFGADYLNDYLTTYQFVNGEVKKQYSADAFAQIDYNPTAWLNIVGSVRYDYFSASHSNAPTARLATMFKWDGFSVRASYAGGFRAPSLKEMYMNFDMAGIMMIYGNENLKPEKSHNFNVALEHTGRMKGLLEGSYSVTLMGYCNKYDKRITTTDFAGDATREEGSIYTNESGVSVYGSDLSAQYRAVCGLGVKLNYNYMYIDGNSLESQFTQPRPHTATWRIDYDKQLCSAYGFNVSLSGRYLSAPKTKRETDGAYAMWKLSLAQRVWSGISINCVADNLFGYRPKVYYWNSAPTAGRSFSIGVSVDLDKLL